MTTNFLLETTWPRRQWNSILKCSNRRKALLVPLICHSTSFDFSTCSLLQETDLCGYTDKAPMATSFSLSQAMGNVGRRSQEGGGSGWDVYSDSLLQKLLSAGWALTQGPSHQVALYSLLPAPRILYLLSPLPKGSNGPCCFKASISCPLSLQNGIYKSFYKYINSFINLPWINLIGVAICFSLCPTNS